MKKIFLFLALTFCVFAQSQTVTQYTTATSGTVTSTDTQQDVFLIHESGTTLTMTIAFPSNPADGQKLTFVSVGGVTTLSLTAAVGTIVNAITGMSAGVPATYVYYKPTNKWYKIR